MKQVPQVLKPPLPTWGVGGGGVTTAINTCCGKVKEWWWKAKMTLFNCIHRKERMCERVSANINLQTVQRGADYPGGL